MIAIDRPVRVGQIRPELVSGRDKLIAPTRRKRALTVRNGSDRHEESEAGEGRG
jgi:hypothetical protein